MSDEFDIAEFDSVDEAEMVVKNPRTGEPTTWVWTFFGPSHAKTVELFNVVGREQLREEREKEQARVNGKKWRGEDRSLDELRDRNISRVVARVKSWTPVRLEGETLTFSEEATKTLLKDIKRAWLLRQIADFLADDDSFTKPSATP